MNLLTPGFPQPAGSSGHHPRCRCILFIQQNVLLESWEWASRGPRQTAGRCPLLILLRSFSRGCWVLPIPAVIPSYHPRIPTSCWHCPQGALGMLSQEVGIPIGITASAPFPIVGLYSHWAFPGFGFFFFQQLLPFIGTLDNYRPGRNVKTGSENARNRDVSQLSGSSGILVD